MQNKEVRQRCGEILTVADFCYFGQIKAFSEIKISTIC